MHFLIRIRFPLLFFLFLFFVIPSFAEFSAPIDPGFGEVVFCGNISPSGDPLYIADSFPSSSRQVLAYIPFNGMQDGEPWGMYWTVNGEEYADERNQTWDLGSEGWVSYDVTSDGILLEGVWHLDLYQGNETVESVSFTVSGDETSVSEETNTPLNADQAAFGRIRFAEGVTDELVPIRPADEFIYGIKEISVIFSYYGMGDGLPWTREWLLNGEDFIRVDDTWEEGPEGITSRSMGYEEDLPLDPGTYTLNLYIDGQLARSADLIVNAPKELTPPELPPPTPDDLIDEELLPAWQMLADSPTEVVREIAQESIKNGIEIRLVDEGDAIAWYRYAKGTAEIGDIYVKRSKYNQYSRVEVAATVAHELTHAMQHAEEGEEMHCSVENEYWAYIVELYVLLDNGRKDLIYENWSGLFDENWDFDTTKLWAALKKAYNSCPEY